MIAGGNTQNAVVFIVTSGEYSDYCISSVWANQLDADHEAARLRADGHYAVEVEEWQLNDSESSPVLQWQAYLTARGEIVVRDSPWEVQQVAHTTVQRDGRGWRGWGYGPSPEHARKSLSDALAKAKAAESGL